jgi:large subunit ribosomal protein L10
MTKIGLVIKQETERILKEKLKEAEGFLLVKYSGLSATDLNILRGSLSDIGSSFMVIKNSVSKRLFKSDKDLYSLLEGPCGLIFINKDLILTSRVLYNFTQDKPGLELKSGLLNNRIITKKEIETLSKIPSLSVLQGQMVGGLKSPIFGLVFGLKQILNKLVWALGQLKDKKNK